ncbi:MAG: helix-turn-helix transcriptional regulator [Candidatus Pacearchaeota archaeon]
MKITSEKIKQLRQKLKLKQKEFANLIGITWQYLSALENNKKSISHRVAIFVHLLDTLDLNAETARHFYKRSCLHKK